jgi:uroporphyrinogen-III decarboxylase
MDNIIKTRKQRWIDLYSDGTKPGAVIFIGQNYGPRPLPFPENKGRRIEYAKNMYDIQTESLDYMDDDKIPFLSPYTGTEIFARAFGCKVHYPDSDMPFALPFVNNAAEAAKVTYPDMKNSPAIAEIFEIADKLREHAPGAIMQLPDIQSPLDIAALIWNKEDFFASMYEEPRAVKDMILMIEKFLTEFLDLWFGRYGTEFIAHYPDYYMPRGVTFSEDEVGTISSDMFREFSLGSLNRLSERYGMAGMHCCAFCEHQWEAFKEIKNLKLFNQNLSDEVNQKAYKYFEDTCVQMHSSNINDELFLHNGKNMRLVIQDWANTKEEAAEKSKRLREKYCSHPS